MKIDIQKLKIRTGNRHNNQVRFSNRSQLFNEDIVITQEGISISSWVGCRSSRSATTIPFKDHVRFGDMMVAVCEERGYSSLYKKRYKANCNHYPVTTGESYSLYDIMHMIRECEE